MCKWNASRRLQAICGLWVAHFVCTEAHAAPVILDAGSSPSVGISPQGIAVGHLNADGHDDFVVTNTTSTSVSVLLGLGGGLFQAPVSYATGSFPYAVALDDFDNDGYLDMIVVNRGAASVSLLRGNGNGTFQMQQTFAAGYSPRGAGSGDFGHGRRDLAVTNGPDATISVLLNNGSGGFAPQVVYPSGGNHPEGIVVARLDPAGNNDLVAAAGTVVSVLRGNGDGTFQPVVTYPATGSPTGIAAADMNGDGVADIVVANGNGDSISVFIGNGDGTLKPRVDYVAGVAPYAVAIGDFNGDGIKDVVAAEWGSTNSNVLVLLGVGNGTLQPYQASAGFVGSARGIAVGQFESAQDDVVVADNTNNVAHVLLNRGVIFADRFELPPGDCPPGMIRLSDGSCGPV